MPAAELPHTHTPTHPHTHTPTHPHTHTPALTLACQAMGCRWEIVLCGGDPARLRAAGEEALAEVERLEAQLSLFRPEGELSGINARAALGPVRVEPGLFDLLALCRDFHQATRGAFDVTVSPLMACWGFRGREGQVPSEDALEAARACVGMQHVLLDAEERSVRFARPGVSLDLGGIGKGYAIGAAAGILRELGVASALLHAGTSSVYAIGAPPEEDAWRVAIRNPAHSGEHLAVEPLRDMGLSVSAVHGRNFRAGGCIYGHVMDPRTGCPAEGPQLAAVVHPSPTLAEALSTALLVAGEELLPVIISRWPEARCVAA